jgi:hypothetical protein
MSMSLLLGSVNKKMTLAYGTYKADKTPTRRGGRLAQSEPSSAIHVIQSHEKRRAGLVRAEGCGHDGGGGGEGEEVTPHPARARW